MSDTEASQPGAITLADLIALNEEITSLVHAGVPLEPALAELGRDLPGRLGRITSMVAEASRRGESLPKIVSQQSARWPSVYRAVVEAGLKAGRLPAALESLAGSIRRIAETRRGVAMAALYPLFVLILAWAFFAMFAGALAPRLFAGFDSLDVPGGELFAKLSDWGRSVAYWGPALPLIVLIAAGCWWYLSGRANVVEPHRSGWLLGRLPWTGRLLRWSRVATFAEVLALLVENRVPLHKAIVLAAEASGGRETVAMAKQIAAALARGESAAVADELARGSARAARAGWDFPPLLCWLIATGQRHDALLPALRHAAETYRRRARHQAELARVFLPVVMTVAIGGTAVLLYALALFVPYASMLKALGGP